MTRYYTDKCDTLLCSGRTLGLGSDILTQMRPGWLPVNQPKFDSTRDQQPSAADDVSDRRRRLHVLDEQSPADRCRHCHKSSSIIKTLLSATTHGHCQPSCEWLNQARHTRARSQQRSTRWSESSVVSQQIADLAGGNAEGQDYGYGCLGGLGIGGAGC